MNKLCDPKEIARLKQKYKFSLSRDFSQNFLIDEQIPVSIAEVTALENCFCLEIGPGIGALSYELCARAEAVTAVELDQRLYPVLAETLAGCANFELVQGDAMKVSLDKLAKKDRDKNIIFGNLPYNITTKLVKKIASLKNYRAAYLMMQKEAAKRLCAPPGDEACSEVSYLISYYTKPRLLFEVPRDAFQPAPAVTSAVVELCYNRDRPEPAPELFQFIGEAFSQRRKTLVNNLAKKYGRQTVETALKRLEIPLDIRGERLKLEEFQLLFDILFTN